MNGLAPTVRPWWQSAFMFDAVSTGGMGYTTPIFRHFGAPGEIVDSLPVAEGSKTPLAYGLLLVGSLLGGLFGYGFYGALRDRGWGPWKSGAAVGLTSGVSALAMLKVASVITGRQFVGVRMQ